MNGSLCRCILYSSLMLLLGTTAVRGSSNKTSLIKQLTSKKAARDVEKDIQKIARPSRRDVHREDGLHIHSLGVGVGQTFIKGDFTPLGSDKITLDLLYNYTASHSFDLLLNLHYSQHSFSKTFVRLPGMAIGIKGKLYRFDSFYPYVLGGFGFYAPKVRRESQKDSKSKLVFGTHIGVGCDLQLNRNVSFGILGHHHNPFDVQQEEGRSDVEGSYLKLLMTVSYHF